MTYKLLNVIFFVAIVGVSFFYPILENVNKKIPSNVVRASAGSNEPMLFEASLGSQYFLNSNLPINKSVVSPEKKIDFIPFNLIASSGIVMDLKTKDLLFGKNVDEKVSIASITKLMTALVFLDEKPNFNNLYKVSQTDRRNGGRIYIYTGEEIKIDDLFNISLIASANTATIAMISSTGFTEREFVERMNSKAVELGLKDTFFVDATGLSEENLSTARDVAKLARFALLNEKISVAVKSKSYAFITNDKKKRIVYSTDELLETFEDDNANLLGGKTGYNRLAGYCFVSKFKNSYGNEVVSVVMGAKEKQDRFLETEKMVKWVYDNYEWK